MAKVDTSDVSIQPTHKQDKSPPASPAAVEGTRPVSTDEGHADSTAVDLHSRRDQIAHSNLGGREDLGARGDRGEKGECDSNGDARGHQLKRDSEDHPPTASHGLAAAYAPIGQEMKRVEDLLQEVFQHENPFINDLLRHGSLLGGKRIRPALLLLAAKACGEVDEAHIVLATAIEMIHTASLVHDDVLDESDTRRHVPTIHRKWNQESSVLFGDYLFTQAFFLVGERVGGKACGQIAGVTNRVCEGELRQIASRGNFNLPLDEYFAIIEAKTAALCQIATRLGAQFALGDERGELVDDDASRATRQVAAMSEYGRLLGLAFQIADDVLDLDGDEALTGKSLGRDFEMSKATLPLILALKKADPADRERMLEKMTGGRLDAGEVRSWVVDLGGVQAARAEARRYAREASQIAEQWVGDTAAGQVLMRLSQFVIERRF